MKLYVAGPMRGKPDHGFPDFFRAKRQLERMGKVVVLPIEDGDLDAFDDPTKPYSSYMKRDIRLLSDCDGIALLPGWRQSVGATFEARSALEFDLNGFELVRVGPSEEDVALREIDLEFLRGAV